MNYKIKINPRSFKNKLPKTGTGVLIAGLSSAKDCGKRTMH